MFTAPDSFGEWPLRRLMTEVVGSGHRSVEDMSRVQAREAFRRILAGDRTGTFADAVVLNAALRMYAREDAADLESCVGRARTAIDAGTAAERLAALRDF